MILMQIDHLISRVFLNVSIEIILQRFQDIQIKHGFHCYAIITKASSIKKIDDYVKQSEYEKIRYIKVQISRRIEL